MTESKKPGASGPSGTFEPLRPSLVPAPAILLPPPTSSVATMAPIEVARPGSGRGVLPSALRPMPTTAPPAVVAAPHDSASASAPPRPVPSLVPSATAAKRGVWLVVLAAALVAVALIVVRSRRGPMTDAAAGALGHVGAFASTLDVRTFQRGNIHTHTTRSDGRQPPQEVAAWYRDHGYQFLVISDHDTLVDPAELRELEGPSFVLIPGEEISSRSYDKQVHVQGLCIDHVIASGQYETAGAAVAQAIADVRAQNGVAVINHPNLGWSLGLADIAPLQGPYALEIWSGHPGVRSAGDATHLSHEALWDELLTRGRHVTAVGVDDEHTLEPTGASADALPGRAWVETFGELGRAPVCDALRGGRLYVSTGVAFRRIRVEPRRLTVWVDRARDEVEFVANAAHILALVTGDQLVQDDDGFAASYVLRGGETYVRAVARAPDGTAAWTQAYDTRL